MDISFIIVNYKSRHYLKKCILSIEKFAHAISHEIIIVNNDETSLDDVFFLPNLKIIEHAKNKGFGTACNLGAVRSSGSLLFFLNPDTQIQSLDISNFLETFADRNIGIVAPKLITDDNKTQQWSAGYDITLWDVLKNNLGSIKSKHLWTISHPTEVDWVSGGALAIAKKVFEDVGGFDEKFFMYFEDADLCKRVRKFGKKIVLLPDSIVLHFDGKSAANTKEKKGQYYQSQDYYFKKHFGLLQLLILKTARSIVLFLKKSF